MSGSRRNSPEYLSGTQAPNSSYVASVLDRHIVMRPVPSGRRTASPRVRSAASERRKPASETKSNKAMSSAPAWQRSRRFPSHHISHPGKLGSGNKDFRAATSKGAAWAWDRWSVRAMPAMVRRMSFSATGLGWPAALCAWPMALALAGAWPRWRRPDGGPPDSGPRWRVKPAAAEVPPPPPKR